LRLLGWEPQSRCLRSSTAYLEGRDEVPVFIQIAGFFEVLVPDSFWIGLWTPIFFSMISLAESVGLLVPRGTTCTIEASVFLAYVASIAIPHAGRRLAPRPSEPAPPRSYASGLFRRTVRDATE
jgi:hypothetical protein